MFRTNYSSNNNNYFLIEFRKFNATMQLGSTTCGDYNTYVPHGNKTEGMVVWRKDNDVPHGRILHADGSEWTTGYFGDSGDLFPGTEGIKVLSPWSDSRTTSTSNSWIPNTTNSSNCGMEILSMFSTYYQIKVYNSQPIDASPSKVQNLHFTYANQSHPSLGWDANSEDDLLSYKVYRSYDNGYWAVAGTVSPPTTTFIDYDVDYTKPIWAKSVRYHVKAVDSTSLYSVESNEIETTGIIGVPHKIAGSSINNSFELFANYPNPFNPTTKITFSLSGKGYTQLKIYNSIGEEVAELVNNLLEAGIYSVDFNAANLPSGIYLYKLTSGKYVQTKKMILLK